MKGAFYLWLSLDREREVLKALPASQDIPPTGGSAHPLYPSEDGRQEDTLSSGQHRMCHFWSEAARPSRSEMPSASRLFLGCYQNVLPMAHSRKTQKASEFFSFPWEIGFSKTIYFQGPQSTTTSKVVLLHNNQ